MTRDWAAWMVLAGHIHSCIAERESRLNSCINPVEAEKLRDELHKIQAQVHTVQFRTAILILERAAPETFKALESYVE